MVSVGHVWDTEHPSPFFSSRILLSLLRVPPYTLQVSLFLEEKLFLTCTIKPQNHHHRLHLHHHHHGHYFPFGCNSERELTSLCFAIIDQFASITSHLLLHRHFFTLFTLSVSLSLLLSLLPVVPLSPVVTFRRRCSIEGDGQLLQSPQSCSAPSPALLRAPFLLAWDCCPAASWSLSPVDLPTWAPPFFAFNSGLQSHTCKCSILHVI